MTISKLLIDTASVRDGYSDKWHFFDDSKLKLIEESKVVVKILFIILKFIYSNILYKLDKSSL